MSSTNKTAKLGLSQFLGTDKPAWLGDYNSDMQKIDDAFANLEQSGQSSAADIALLQQKDVDLAQDITDVNDRVDTVSTDLIKVANRTTVLEGNYDTMHHELALAEEEVETQGDSIKQLENKVTELTRVATPVIYLDVVNGNDENSGLKETEPLKTLSAVSLRAGKFTTALSVHIKAGTTVEISGNIRINNLINLKTYGTGDNAKIKATDSAQIRTTDRLTIDKIDFENATVDSNKFFDFYAPYLAFNDCNITGYGFAVFAPSLFSRCTFTDVVNLNPIGTIIGLRSCNGRITRMGGFGAMINIDETNLTVENFVSPYVKNNYQ